MNQQQRVLAVMRHVDHSAQDEVVRVVSSNEEAHTLVEVYNDGILFDPEYYVGAIPLN